ncbi:MAG TPA: PEP-CTERM sorting domain-containing protein, partial [Steroidobacteraceae bacterium]
PHTERQDKSKFQVRTIAATVALLVAAGVQAAPTSTGIGAVTILGTAYDVSLLYDSDGTWESQSFNALGPTLTFTTQADATAAAEALRDTFGTSFDWSPAGSISDGTRVIFGFDDSTYSYMTVTHTGPTYVFGPFTVSRDYANTFSFAQFTTAVPEPETYALMLLGLAGLGVVARRRRS